MHPRTLKEIEYITTIILNSALGTIYEDYPIHLTPLAFHFLIYKTEVIGTDDIQSHLKFENHLDRSVKNIQD